MEFDLALISMPAFTQKCPSLGLASLAAYLKEKGRKIVCYDYGIPFYQKYLKKYQVSNPLVRKLNLSLYPLWGASNWLGFEEILPPKDGQSIIKSLCPVCSDLYQPIFKEFLKQISLTKNILTSYAKELIKLDTNVYGFSLLIGNAMATLYTIKKIKQEKPDAIIIVGGPEASPYYRADYYSQLDEIDFIIYHIEGELPLESILSYNKGEVLKHNIPGICFKTHDKIQKTNPPPPLNLNKIPPPDFESIETERNSQSLNSLDILISKGCPHNCTFCNEPLLWGSYRPKSAATIFREIKYYIEHYGISHFELGDNSFTSSPSLLKALHNLSNAGIKIQWGGNCRINELNMQKLNDFRRYGLTHCYFGIESASPQALQTMNKNINLLNANKLLKACNQNQIKSVLYFMIGFPNETPQEFHKTLTFIEENFEYIYDISVSVFTLMANTPIFYSKLITPIPLGPQYFNAFTYQTKDGVTHEIRRERFLKIHEYKGILKSQ